MDHRKRGMFLGTKMLGDPNDRESSQKVIITPNNNKTMEETSGTWGHWGGRVYIRFNDMWLADI